jgi:hypothetical protein
MLTNWQQLPWEEVQAQGTANGQLSPSRSAERNSLPAAVCLPLTARCRAAQAVGCSARGTSGCKRPAFEGDMFCYLPTTAFICPISTAQRQVEVVTTQHWLKNTLWMLAALGPSSGIPVAGVSTCHGIVWCILQLQCGACMGCKQTCQTPQLFHVGIPAVLTRRMSATWSHQVGLLRLCCSQADVNRIVDSIIQIIARLQISWCSSARLQLILFGWRGQSCAQSALCFVYAANRHCRWHKLPVS